MEEKIMHILVASLFAIVITISFSGCDGKDDSYENKKRNEVLYTHEEVLDR